MDIMNSIDGMHNVGCNLEAILGGKRHVVYREQYKICL